MTYSTETSTSAGLVISLNDHDIILTPGDFRGGTEEKIYELTERVELGTPADFMQFLADTFDAPRLTQFDNLPAPFDAIAKKLATMKLTIEEFRFVVAPTKKLDGTDIPVAEQKPNTFVFRVSALWKEGDEISLIGNKLKVKGLHVSVERKAKEQTAPPAPPAVQPTSAPKALPAKPPKQRPN